MATTNVQCAPDTRRSLAGLRPFGAAQCHECWQGSRGQLARSVRRFSCRVAIQAFRSRTLAPNAEVFLLRNFFVPRFAVGFVANYADLAVRILHDYYCDTADGVVPKLRLVQIFT